MSSNSERLTEADIDAMNQGKVYQRLTDFGVGIGDFDNLEEAKTTLKEKIQELKRVEENGTSVEQVAEMMTSVAESYRAKRELLLQRCQDIKAYLPTLDQNDREKLTIHFRRDVMGILGEVQEHLSKDDCPILVAGETSAGKSTFLNLLLGENILPVAHLSSTSTICELKYGETRQAVVHLREPDPATGSHQVTLTLSADPEQCRQQLESYIHLKATERETLPPATKIEIFWPLVLLKGGVTIVDSPGVGENEMMDDVIARYIPSAFAFIYIIDSYRAGGVQQDRLGRLLTKCKDQFPRSELKQFDSRKAIFVCNKWDLVPPAERQKVKEDTIWKLGKMWRGLDESQVLFFSNKEAVKGEFRSADFNKLLDGIYELLPQSLHHKLDVQYRQMTNILEEALKFVRLKLNNTYRSTDARGNAEALSRFDKSTAQILKKTRDFLENAVDLKGLTILTELLHGDELSEHLFKVPIKAGNEEGAIEQLMSKAERYLTSHQKFQDHVKATNQQFIVMFQKVLDAVSHEYDKSITPLLDEVGGVMLTTVGSVIWALGSYGSFVFAPVLLFITIPSALVLVGATIIGIFESFRLHGRSKLIDKVIAAMEKNKRLHALVRDNLRSSFEVLDEFESKLQATKELVQRLMEERLKETRSRAELDRTYQPQASGITLQLGRLAMVELGEMREFDFDWPDPQKRISGGSYGEVHRVQVQRKGESVRAALKVGVYPYSITTAENAWKFLTEEDSLRKLTGEHIVEYYGTVYKKEARGLRLGLVMELCVGTLEDRVIGQREHNPTWWGHDAVMKQRAFSYIQDKAVQLCEGLRTIHNAGYIHRDLKLINILVTPADTVKLTDFGEATREADVTGTVTGTAIYAAPEVKEGKMHDKSADIYSLGLILWEMWYGRSIWDALKDGSLRSPIDSVSMMMPHSPDSVRPIPEWRTLVRDCVKRDASRRPTALECLQRIRDMATEDRPSTSATRSGPRRRTGPRLQP